MNSTGYCLALVFAWSVCGSANAQQLTIVSSQCGTSVSTGQTVTGSVTMQPQMQNQEIVVYGSDSAVPMQIVNGPSYAFNIQIPPIQPGDLDILATANVNGVVIDSARCTLTVERSDTPTDLSVPTQMSFTYLGQTQSLDVTAIGSGTMWPVNESTQMTVTSDNPQVVTVAKGGKGLYPGYRAFATGAGSTVLRVSYKGVTKTIIISVPVFGLAVGDLNGDHLIDQLDLNVLLGALNTPITTANDARDLNHDGKIDALDVRILTTLCSRPRCAVQ